MKKKYNCGYLIKPLGSKRGMTLVELVLAMSVLLMCAFLFVAEFPMSTQSRNKVDLRSKAVSLAQRQLETARDAGYNTLVTYSGLYSKGAIDYSPTSTPYSCTNVTLGSGMSIANSLPQGTGTMSVVTQSPELLRVTVTVSWNDRGTQRSVTLATLISYI